MSAFSPDKKSLSSNVVLFGETLRASGCRLSLSEVIDAAEAVSRINIFDRKLFYYTLRTTLVKDESFFLKFDALFRQFWSVDQPLQARQKEFSKQERGQSAKTSFDVADRRKPPLDEKDSRELALYSAVERKSYQRLADAISPEKINLMKRMVRKFKRRVATLPGRRRIPAHSGEIDIRRSLRRAVSRGGSSIVLEKTEKKPSRAKLIVLADISGSMQSQSDDIFLLLYLFKNVSRNSEIFVFSTKLLRLKHITSFGNLRDASRAISRQVSIWGSGTRIGECLHSFVTQYKSMIDPEATVVIISDGWDLGEPETLRMAMSELRRNCSKIVWFNPLIKTKGYEPVCVGMKTALEFVDVFAPTEVFLDRGLFESYFGKNFGPSTQIAQPSQISS
jgi:uncharacterized protein